MMFHSHPVHMYAIYLQDSEDGVCQNIILMTEFALALMTSLEKFNNNSFNLFKLRIGKQCFM